MLWTGWHTVLWNLFYKRQCTIDKMTMSCMIQYLNKLGSITDSVLLTNDNELYYSIPEQALFYKRQYWQNDNELYDSIPERALDTMGCHLDVCISCLILLTPWSNEHVCMLINIPMLVHFITFHVILDFTLLKVAVPLTLELW